MTEKKPDVPVEGTEEGLTPPTPAISPASERVSSAETGFDVVAFEERISAKIDEIVASIPHEVDRRFKSTTDKSFQDVRKVAQYLEQFGGDVEKATREMAIDELLEGRKGEVGDPGRSPEPSTQLSEADFQRRTAEILEEAGIPLDDPEVLDLAKEKVASEADWYRKLTKLGVKRAKQGGIGTGAAVGDAGGPVKPAEDDALLDEIQDLLRHPIHNAKRIDELTAEARKRGLLQ